MYKLGYNTNGLVHHRWDQALELIAEVGYQSVAITVDHHCLNPFASTLAFELSRMRKKLEELQLSSVIETGARFLLNPRKKHEPTLMSTSPAEREVRIQFLCKCIDIAAELGSEAVSFWSGILREPMPRSEGISRLAAGCRKVMLHAQRRKVPLAFEPEPGMFIESMRDFADLLECGVELELGLTLDIGHIHCVESDPIPEVIARWKNWLLNVHIEDMLQGVHEHLPFGEGTIDFPPVLAALAESGYEGGVHVELSRHSHEAPERLQQSFEFLMNARR